VGEPLGGPGRLKPLAACFALFGGFWGAQAVVAADLERALGLSSGGFGLLLALALSGAAVANACGGALVERRGTRPVLAGGLLAWAAVLLAGALVHQRVALGVLVCLVVTAGGLMDVAMNVAAAAALSATPGHLVRFHALFNGGAAAGAAGIGAVVGAGHSWRWAWLVVGSAAAVLAAGCARARLPAGEAGRRIGPTHAIRLLRADHLLLLAVAFGVAAMVEGGIDLWAVLFLRTQLASGLLVGAGGAVLGYLVAAAARVLVGPRIGAAGAGPGVAIGAGLAAGGLVLMAAAPDAALAAVGLVGAAAGVSMCWPLLVALAATGHERPGPVVGAVSSVGYLGLVVGPAVVGLVSGGLGLRDGLGLLALAAAAVAGYGWRGHRSASAARPDRRAGGLPSTTGRPAR
jgi:hypothetical protein